jgi:hypothetical protein
VDSDALPAPGVQATSEENNHMRLLINENKICCGLPLALRDSPYEHESIEILEYGCFKGARRMRYERQRSDHDEHFLFLD